MEERFAPSGRPALARKARFFIWGFAAFCAILVLLAWFLRPNPSAVLWRAQEERSAAQRAYDSRTFVDACNASLQPYGMETSGRMHSGSLRCPLMISIAAIWPFIHRIKLYCFALWLRFPRNSPMPMQALLFKR